MVEFPPPTSGSGAAAVEPDYPSAPARPGFVFPPPRQSSGSVRDAGRYVGEIMRATSDLAANTAGEVQNLGVVVADYGDALERKVEPWAVPTVAPLSQTINRRADPTFQLSDFMSPLVRGRTDLQGHNHEHVVTSSVWGLAEGWMEGNRTYVAFITPAINRAYEEINFMVGAVTVPAANMDIAIYVVDENRQLVRQLGNIRISDEIGLGRQLVTRKFDRWVATQGSYIAVAVRQWADGNQRPLLGLFDTPRPLSNVVFPRKITAYRHDSTSALPAVIDGETSLDFESDWFVPYIELSEAVGVDYRAFSDSWPDVGEAPRPWVRLTSRGINSSGGYTAAAGVGLRVSMYDTPLSTDRVRIRSSIFNDGVGTGSNSRRSTLIVRGTNNLRSGIGLSAIGHTRYELIRWSNLDVASDGEWNDRTVVTTINSVPTEGDQLEVDYLDGLVTVRINNQTVVDSLPVAGPEGAAGRFVGIQNRRQAFITAVFSPWFGPWSARDLPPENGDDDEGEGE